MSSIEFSNFEEDSVLFGLGILGDLGLLGLRNPGDNLEGMTVFIVRQTNINRAVFSVLFPLYLFFSFS